MGGGGGGGEGGGDWKDKGRKADGTGKEREGRKGGEGKAFYVVCREKKNNFLLFFLFPGKSYLRSSCNDDEDDFSPLLPPHLFCGTHCTHAMLICVFMCVCVCPSDPSGHSSSLSLTHTHRCSSSSSICLSSYATVTCDG